MKIYKDYWILNHHSIVQTILEEGRIASLIREEVYQEIPATKVELLRLIRRKCYLQVYLVRRLTKYHLIRKML
jgi:hypothetical protein